MRESDPAGAQPLAETVGPLLLHIGVVCSAVSAQRDALDHEAVGVDLYRRASAGPLRRQLPRQSPHQGEARALPGRTERRDQLLARDRVHQDVDAFRGRLGELVRDGPGPSQHDRVVAQLGHQTLRFLRRAGTADHPACPQQPGDLPRQGTHRSRRSGDEDHVTLTNVGKSGQRTIGRRSLGKVSNRIGQRIVQRSAVAGGHQGVLPPAVQVRHHVARAQGTVVRGGNDLADTGAEQGVTAAQGRQRHSVDLPADQGTQAGEYQEVPVPDEHLTRTRFGQRRLGDDKVFLCGQSLRDGGEPDFAGGAGQGRCAHAGAPGRVWSAVRYVSAAGCGDVNP
ncbi:hypothetical protein STENM223S_09982 [Streptomyces tendae]